MTTTNIGISHVTGRTSSASERMLAASLSQYAIAQNNQKTIVSSDSATNRFQNFRFANLKVKKDNSAFFDSTSAFCGTKGNKNNRQGVPTNFKVRDIPPCVVSVGSQSATASGVCSNPAVLDYAIPLGALSGHGIYNTPTTAPPPYNAAPYLPINGEWGINLNAALVSNERDTLRPITVFPLVGGAGSAVLTEAALIAAGFAGGYDALAQIVITRVTDPDFLSDAIASGSLPGQSDTIAAPLPIPSEVNPSQFTVIQLAQLDSTGVVSPYVPFTFFRITTPFTKISIDGRIGTKGESILIGTYAYEPGDLGPLVKQKDGKGGGFPPGDIIIGV